MADIILVRPTHDLPYLKETVVKKVMKDGLFRASREKINKLAHSWDNRLVCWNYYKIIRLFQCIYLNKYWRFLHLLILNRETIWNSEQSCIYLCIKPCLLCNFESSFVDETEAIRLKSKALFYLTLQFLYHL